MEIEGTSTKLSVILVNWNSIEYLRDSIASIYEFTRGIPFEIIVVDNASPNGGADVLQQQFPEITLIKSADNLGFGRANNLGFGASRGECILFLNPDTKLVSPAIDRMLQSLKSLPNAGIVGCKLLNGDLSVQTSCIQKFPTVLNQVLDIDYLRRRWPDSGLWEIGPLFSDGKQPVRVEVVSGACMMIKRDVFEAAGKFSEDYFMYGEDLDLCYQVSRAGFVNWYVGDASVIHYGGKSSTPEWATIMKWNSILHYCVKNRGSVYAVLFRIAIAVAAMGRLTILVALSLFRREPVDQNTQWPSAAKWRAILRTVVMPPGSRPMMPPAKVSSHA